MTLPGITSEAIFVCVDTEPFCEPWYGKAFTARAHVMKRWCKVIGIKPFGWHGIRHFTASTIFNKGYPIAHIQTILRHQNPYTTEKYLRSLGLRYVRTALEEGLKRDAESSLFPARRFRLDSTMSILHPSFTPSTKSIGVAYATL